MQLSLKTFSQLIEDMGAALQGSATSLVDVSVGSVIRAIFEANASVGSLAAMARAPDLEHDQGGNLSGP